MHRTPFATAYRELTSAALGTSPRNRGIFYLALSAALATRHAVGVRTLAAALFTAIA